MKMVKGLLLGSAAGFAVVTGAQAADLPVKAKPVQYVKICSLYGDGFYYIPGSDTCIRFSGYVRADYNFNGRNPHVSGANGAQDRTVQRHIDRLVVSQTFEKFEQSMKKFERKPKPANEG